MSNEIRVGAGVIGTLRTVDGAGAVRMEDLYDTDIDDLWLAITEPPRLARWIAEVEGDLRVGGEFHARFTSGWEGTGRVDVCDSPRLLRLTMSQGDGEDDTVMEAELVSEGDKTRLVIEERGLPLDELAGHGAGWQAHVEDLAAYLAGRECLDWRTRWTELTPLYRDRAAELL